MARSCTTCGKRVGFFLGEQIWGGEEYMDFCSQSCVDVHLNKMIERKRLKEEERQREEARQRDEEARQRDEEARQREEARIPVLSVSESVRTALGVTQSISPAEFEELREMISVIADQDKIDQVIAETNKGLSDIYKKEIERVYRDKKIIKTQMFYQEQLETDLGECLIFGANRIKNILGLELNAEALANRTISRTIEKKKTWKEIKNNLE